MQLFSNFSRLTRIVKPFRTHSIIHLDTCARNVPRRIRERFSVKSLVWRGFRAICTASIRVQDLASFHVSISGTMKSMPCSRPSKKQSAHCTKSCHPPVDGLHSIENKSDKVALFSLTQNLKGVQQDRSLTVSLVFPVGAASGAQAQSLSHCKMRREGKQGSIAKRWSRRTRIPVEGRIEFRGVE